MVRLLERMKERIAASSSGKEKKPDVLQLGAPATERAIGQVELRFGFELPASSGGRRQFVPALACHSSAP
jgi:hypothetical protein